MTVFRAWYRGPASGLLGPATLPKGDQPWFWDPLPDGAGFWASVTEWKPFWFPVEGSGRMRCPDEFHIGPNPMTVVRIGGIWPFEISRETMARMACSLEVVSTVQALLRDGACRPRSSRQSKACPGRADGSARGAGIRIHHTSGPKPLCAGFYTFLVGKLARRFSAPGQRAKNGASNLPFRVELSSWLRSPSMRFRIPLAFFPSGPLDLCIEFPGGPPILPQ